MATKDISDVQVCRAVDAYNRAIKALPPPASGFFGLSACGPLPPFPYEALAASTGQPEKVCYRAMERAERRGLIEYGTALRTGWLTAEGRALLDKED